MSKIYFSICRYLCDICLERARENNLRYNLVQPKNVEASFCDLVASSGVNLNSEQTKRLSPRLNKGFRPVATSELWPSICQGLLM